VIPVFSAESSGSTGIDAAGTYTTVLDINIGGPTGSPPETAFIQGVNIDGAIVATIQGVTAYYEPGTGYFGGVQFYVVDKQERASWPVTTTIYIRYMTVMLEAYEDGGGGGTGGIEGGGAEGGGDPGGGGGGEEKEPG
jgi:hypothetical protein